MSILIQNVFHEDKNVDVFIHGNLIDNIGENLKCQADIILDGTDKAILPSFINSHTHAAMTLMRGYADDMLLHEWLTEYIWPLEAKLTEEDVYHGTRLAVLEMIKSGTTAFNDMYWHRPAIVRAAESMGIRAAISAVFIDFGDENKANEQKSINRDLFVQNKQYSDRITFTLGPHAIYTVSEKSLRWCKEFAEEHDLLIHMHVSETKKEVQDALNQFGKRPVQYLNSIGLLSPRLISCHTVWCDEREIELLAQNSVKVVHNPVSNMKLCSGNFRYDLMKKWKVTVALGTDGCSSNNNLDMTKEMKFAALNAKSVSGDPRLLTAREAFATATINGATTLRLNCGKIEKGSLADCILVNLNYPQMVPNYHLISNMVYSACGSVVDTTICDGKILMRNGKVEGEEEIITCARNVAKKFM